MKKYRTSVNKMFIIALTVAAVFMLLPGTVQAAETDIPPENEKLLTPDVIPMDSSAPEYSALSQFLSLIAGRFQIYVVAAGEPGNTERVSLPIPDGTDTEKISVGEIVQGSEQGTQVPSWIEQNFQMENGMAVIETDHAGIYAVIEKKEQIKLPDSLEKTDKIEKLELTKKYYSGVDTSVSAVKSVSARSAASVPKTGDNLTVSLWGIVASIALSVMAVSVKQRK